MSAEASPHAAPPTPHAAAKLALPRSLPHGFAAAAASAGIRSGPGDDLLLIAAGAPAAAAAVFTRNRFAAAPIALSREHLRESGGRARAILINAGAANAATGEIGYADALRSTEAAAASLQCRREEILVDSTGVIGRRLPIDALVAAIPRLAASLHRDRVEAAARAIMTTDTAPKAAERRIAAADGGEISVVGIAKGAGMIHPDMATMIGVVLCDAALPPQRLQPSLHAAVRRSFNRISIDGDTSTNDAVFALASGARGEPASLAELDAAIAGLCLDLARMIVADGEGAQRLLEVEVRRAATPADALEVARTIGSSLLVRTAVAGGDPNWGRIVAALGRTGAAFSTQAVSISANGHPLFAAGAPCGGDPAALAAAFSAAAVTLEVDLAAGEHADRFLTCDLTAEYCRINGDYTS